MVIPYQKLYENRFNLIEHPDTSLINPASIDIRIGKTLMIEVWSPALPLFLNRLLRPISTFLPKNTKPKFKEIDLTRYSDESPFYIYPGEAVLVSSLENLLVPLDMAMDLRLKSSRARELYDHALAFWFDPAWMGIGTLELRNVSTFARLPIFTGLKIAQVIYHKLTEPCEKGYSGKYRGAAKVEGSKPERPNNS